MFVSGGRREGPMAHASGGAARGTHDPTLDDPARWREGRWVAPDRDGACACNGVAAGVGVVVVVGGGGWGGGGSACRRPECAWCAGGGSVGNGVDLSCSGVGVVGGVRAPLLAGWQCWLRAGWRRGRWWLQCASYAYGCNYHRLHLLACVVGVGDGVRARSRACMGARGGGCGAGASLP